MVLSGENGGASFISTSRLGFRLKSVLGFSILDRQHLLHVQWTTQYLLLSATLNNRSRGYGI